MEGDGTAVVLDVVNLLLVLVDNLVSVQDHVASKQSRQACSKPKTEQAIEGLEVCNEWLEINCLYDLP